MIVYVIDDEMNQPGTRCIPNAPGLSGGASLTLCGWTDVAYDEHEGDPTCGECLKIAAYCKGLRLPRRSPAA